MDIGDAARLIAPVVSPGRTWAELGAGTGTFTSALAALLGPQGKVFAVERDEQSARALDALTHHPNRGEHAALTVVRADFMRHLNLPKLDGVLLANALHFVADEEQPLFLARVSHLLTPNGVLLVVEYDNRPRSRWVPYPVSLARLRIIATRAALGPIDQVGRIASAFGGIMYAARVARREVESTGTTNECS